MYTTEPLASEGSENYEPRFDHNLLSDDELRMACESIGEQTTGSFNTGTICAVIDHIVGIAVKGNLDAAEIEARKIIRQLIKADQWVLESAETALRSDSLRILRQHVQDEQRA